MEFSGSGFGNLTEISTDTLAPRGAEMIGEPSTGRRMVGWTDFRGWVRWSTYMPDSNGNWVWSEDLPFVIQWNKRDLPGALPVPDLEEELNPEHHSAFEAVAVKGEGVFETLKHVSKMVLHKLN